MRIVIAHVSRKRILQWTQRLLFFASVSALGYYGFARVDAWTFQKRATLELKRWPHEKNPTRTVRERPTVLAPNDLIGRITIPRLGLSAIIAEGTSAITLRHAVGHISRTGLPGQPGNIGLSGHRDTFFQPLKDIRADDIIELSTIDGDYRYRVVGTRVVAPTEVSVLNPEGNELLTLVTCYPFYFIGAAPDRLIVRAERVI
jgi:sortase A